MVSCSQFKPDKQLEQPREPVRSALDTTLDSYLMVDGSGLLVEVVVRMYWRFEKVAVMCSLHIRSVGGAVKPKIPPCLSDNR